MILTIDLGPSKDDIEINPGDSPGRLSKEFCLKHRLATDVQEALYRYLDDTVFNKHTQSAKRLTKTPDREVNGKTESISRKLGSSNEGLPKHTSTTPDYTGRSPEKFNKSVKQFPGERLYHIARENQIKKKENALKIHAEREARETEELSFTPRTNSKSPASQNSHPELHLLQNYQLSKAKLEYIKSKVFKDKYKECSFHPVINKKSEMPTSVTKLEKSESKDKNILLYKSVKAQQEKRETVSLLEYEIIRFEKLSPCSPDKKVTLTDRRKVFGTADRLMRYKLNTENTLEKLRAIKRKLEILDNDTGKVLFTPQINDSRREIREKPVWQELYEESKRKTISPEKPQKISINKNSKKITEKIRYRQYEVIFNSLSPESGRIAYDHINFKTSDKRMVEIIHPIIHELQCDLNFSLNFEEFCEAMDSLIKVLTPQEKWYLIFSYRHSLP